MAPKVGVMLLSQYVEVHHALRLTEEFAGGVGYLLKDRVSELGAFATDVRRVAAGDVVIDPELVARLVRRRRERDPLDALSERERDVLALMARGLANSALAEELSSARRRSRATCGASSPIDLAPGEREHRRVLAVLQFLRSE